MPNEPRRQTSSVLLMCEEAQYRASQEHTPRSFNPTVSTNTMTTTTLVDSSVSATIIGVYLKPEDGLAKDQVRQVKSRSGTTATVDTAWTATTSVTAVRAWLPADVPVRATASGSTTTVVSSPHANITNEPDDYWNAKGYHLLAYGGQNAGKAARVTDFATATGTFTTTDALTSTVADELFVLRKAVRTEGFPTISVNRKSVARTIVGYGDGVQSVGINYEGSASFETAVRGLSAAAGSGTVAVAPVEMSDLLAAIFTQTLDTGATVHGTAPGSGTTFTMSAAPTMTVGGFVLASTGEVAQIRSISGASLTIGTNHITVSSVQAGSVAYAAAHYKRKATDFRTFTIENFVGRLYRQVLHGCLPTLSMTITRDQVVRFAWNYTAGEAHEYTLTLPVAANATLPITILDTTVPFDGKGARCLFNGTQVLMSEFTVNFGFKPVPRNSLSTPNQMDGMAMTLEPIGGTFKILADEDDKASFEDIVDLMNRSGQSTIDFLYQKGSSAGNTFALCIPAFQVTAAPQNYVDGQSQYEGSFIAALPQTVPGNSFNAALPALSMGWL